MHNHIALALVIASINFVASANDKALAQQTCYQTLSSGLSCVGPSGTAQVQQTVVPGQWAINGQSASGQPYGCQAQLTVTGDIASTCP